MKKIISVLALICGCIFSSDIAAAQTQKTIVWGDVTVTEFLNDVQVNEYTFASDPKTGTIIPVPTWMKEENGFTSCGISAAKIVSGGAIKTIYCLNEREQVNTSLICIPEIPLNGDDFAALNLNKKIVNGWRRFTILSHCKVL